MGKIGLCLAFKGTNYGALLQAYATQYYIEKMGHSTEIIDYTPGKDHGLIFNPVGYLFFLAVKIKALMNSKDKAAEDKLHTENKKQRKDIADQYRKTRLKNIIQIKGKKGLINHAKCYDAVIVGSDQLWPPEVGFTYFHTLQFVPKGIRRVSYATSMGVSEYPWFVKRADADFLKKIDYLSVREEQGRKMIKEISGRDAKVVLDPTYLLTKEGWESLIQNRKIINDNYVFCFFLGDNPAMKKRANEYARKNKLKVVSIVSNEVTADDSSYADVLLTNQTPEDFVNLIRHASCVFTDSFHGFTFSIINEKQVFVSYRVRKDVKQRNSRIDNIVTLLGIPERLIHNPEKDVLPEDDIDYSVLNKVLFELRKKSIAFLNSALADI